MIWICIAAAAFAALITGLFIAAAISGKRADERKRPF
jgi:hypothetical protein